MRASPLLGWKNAREAVTWVAPAVGIPLLRFLNDRREQRRELFFRDASTYALGTVIYFGVAIMARKAFARLNWFGGGERRNFMAFLAAILANILYAGIGAVKLSHWMTRHDVHSWHPRRLSPTVAPGVSPPLRRHAFPAPGAYAVGYPAGWGIQAGVGLANAWRKPETRFTGFPVPYFRPMEREACGFAGPVAWFGPREFFSKPAAANFAGGSPWIC